jgi:DNA-binding IclR family transcriptional regulator
MSLELIAVRQGGLTHTEISQMLAIPKSSCSYILSRLERHHYLSRNKDTGRYEVGLKLVGLAHGVRKNSRASSILAPILSKLAEELSMTVAVGVLLQGSAVLIENIESIRPTKFNFSVGLELPIETTALGKILIASLSEEDVTEIIERYGHSPRSSVPPVPRAELSSELELVRKKQYATNTRVPGACSVAVPIFDIAGSVCAGLVATSTANDKIWDRFQDVVAQLRATAQIISSQTRSLEWRLRL